jgi:hypothetical protein
MICRRPGAPSSSRFGSAVGLLLLLLTVSSVLVGAQSGSVIALSGDTTNAPVPSRNPIPECGGLADCINGCRSRFYKVTGGTGNTISAQTCYSVVFGQRTYVWKGSSSDCSTFTCTGTFGGGDWSWFGCACSRIFQRSLTQRGRMTFRG